MASGRQESPSEISSLRCENDEMKRKMAAMEMELRRTNVKYARLENECRAMLIQMEAQLAGESNLLRMAFRFDLIVQEFKQKCFGEVIKIEGDFDEGAGRSMLGGHHVAPAVNNEPQSSNDQVETDISDEPLFVQMNTEADEERVHAGGQNIKPEHIDDKTHLNRVDVKPSHLLKPKNEKCGGLKRKGVEAKHSVQLESGVAIQPEAVAKEELQVCKKIQICKNRRRRN